MSLATPNDVNLSLSLFCLLCFNSSSDSPSISHFYPPCIHIHIPPVVTRTHDALSPQLSDSVIQGYRDAYGPRMDEMHAFNMVRPFPPGGVE